MNPSPKDRDQIAFFKNRKPAGFLKRTPRGYSISFDPSFVGQNLTYHIRGTGTPIIENGTNLPPYFANLLPEGLRLKALQKIIKTSEDDFFSLFAASGADCIGDITAESFPHVTPSARRLRDVNFYELFSESLRHAPDESIAGVQEKISASMISFPLSVSQNRKRYLLKLNPGDKKNLVKNEYHSLVLAKHCGLKTANAKIVVDKDQNDGLLVERFDRVWNHGANDFDFIHQEDGCQLMNLYPAQKYRISINAFAKQIAELASSPEIEILNLIRQVAFSYLLGNGDLHAKNFSLQDVPGLPRQFTPVYDVICTLIYGDAKMALKLDGFDDNLTLKLLIEFGTRFGIPYKACHASLNKLTEKFARHCQKFIDGLEPDPKSKKHLERVFKKRLADLE